MRTTISRRILLAPLDWGLGHTSRCVPLIRFLKGLGHEPILAGNEEQRSYYEQEFPGIRQLPLEGYNITYARSGSGFAARIARQVPGIVRTVRREHEWLLRTAQKEKIEGIISDNRYGLYHPSVPSVIMTHQLQVRTGLGAGADGLFRRLHYRFLEKFGRCWVVDTEEAPGLSGTLAHPARLPRMPLSYLGWLSHLDVPAVTGREPDYDLLVLLSGPEPQRGMLSDMIWKQLDNTTLRVCFVEGSRQAPQREGHDRLHWHRRVGSASLQELLAASALVLCRSGYSTVMDLAAFGKKGIFIPTPGQTEQEYLARLLSGQGVGVVCSQKAFVLEEVLSQARTIGASPPLPAAHERYKAVVTEWLTTLQGSPTLSDKKI